MYRCCDERRRERVLQAIDDGVAINGIDFLEVLDREAPADTPRQRTLLLRFLGEAPALTTQNFVLLGGERLTDLSIEWVTGADAPDAPPAEAGLVAWLGSLPDPERVLVLRTSAAGDYSRYTLRLVASPGALTPPPEIDPVLSEVDFSFKVECPSDFDCEPRQDCPEASAEPPALSYLAKDYRSFRRLMLGRMAQIMPDWRERSPADLGVTLVEMLAYTADRLSYAQDAVATEAYLATARRRSSVRRHARLMDYRMHDGANARAWIHLDVDGEVTVPQGGCFLTRVTGFEALISAGDAARDALNLDPLVFEALHGKDLYPDHNSISFHEWSDAACCLPRGATRATLVGDLPNLAPGDVLVFEERLGPRTGRAADADPAVRHAVRLTAVEAGLTDPLDGAEITEIRWAEEDALPFPLCLSSELDEAVGGGLQRGVSHALGNVLLADHGRTIENEDLGTVPEAHLQLVAEAGEGPCDRPAPRSVPPRYRPRLAEGPVSQVAPFEYPPASAFAATHLRLASRRPWVELFASAAAGVEKWTAVADLLQSAPESEHFVLETEADGSARVRFGDGRHGRRPPVGSAFSASYRIGNGRRGNVGADAIAHLLSHPEGVNLGDISAVRNPIPASGGVDPESMEAVRQAAPYAYRRQERAVTPEDYARMAQRHSDVQRAAATFRWNGHGHTVFVTVDRFDNRPVTPEFEAELRQDLDAVRMAGYDLEIDGPRFVALEIGLFICAHPDHFRSQVRQGVLRALSAGRHADGSTGFFHPDNLTFGTPVHLSAIYSRCMAVEGVASVEARHFRRRGSTRTGALEDGVLNFGRLEIARLENDPSFPERGSLEIEMGGGK